MVKLGQKMGEGESKNQPITSMSKTISSFQGKKKSQVQDLWTPERC